MLTSFFSNRRYHKALIKTDANVAMKKKGQISQKKKKKKAVIHLNSTFETGSSGYKSRNVKFIRSNIETAGDNKRNEIPDNNLFGLRKSDFVFETATVIVFVSSAVVLVRLKQFVNMMVDYLPLTQSTVVEYYGEEN